MGKIQSNHVQAGANKLTKDGFSIGRGTQCCDDLGASLQVGSIRKKVSGGHPIHSDK